MADDGFEMSNYTLENVKQETKTGDRYFATINGQMKANTRGGPFGFDTQILCLSDDGGLTQLPQLGGQDAPDDSARAVFS